MDITIKHDKHDHAVLLLESKLREAAFETNIPSISYYNKAFIMGMIYAFDKTSILSEAEVASYISKVVHLASEELINAMKGVKPDDEM